MKCSKQFAHFFAVGATAALSNWLARVLFSLALPFVWAVPAAFFVGLATAFSLNRLYVFPKTNRPLGEQMGYFLVFNLMMLPVVWGSSLFLVDWFLPAIGWTLFDEEIGHGIALAMPMFISFTLHKKITFASRTPPVKKSEVQNLQR